MFFRIVLLMVFFSFNLSTIASAEAPLTAAFISDNHLWIKKGGQEIQLTKNQYVYNQKWSYDGRFIGYIDRLPKSQHQNNKRDIHQKALSTSI